MLRLPSHLGSQTSTRLATLAAVPAIAVAALGWPCHCAEHRGHEARAGEGRHGGIAPAATRHPATMSMEGNQAVDRPAHAEHAATTDSGADQPSGFRVATLDRPLVANGPEGPLSVSTVPSPAGETRHGTFAQQTVAKQLAIQRGEFIPSQSEALAQRASLSTAAVTKRMSRRCQRLLKKRAPRLSRPDRVRRRKCLALRRKLVAASTQPAPTPGVTAPAPSIQGPTPVAGTAPAATTPATPTTPAETTPATKIVRALTVRAIDNDVPFEFANGSVRAANTIAFGLENRDRQAHNLSMYATDSSGAAVGDPVVIFGDVQPDGIEYQNVDVLPGKYRLVCTIPGHAPMTVTITVTAP